MIDWLTLRLPAHAVPAAAWDRVRDRAGRVVAITADGDIEWEALRWECVRSDSHRVHVRAGSSLEIIGSPARAMGRHNVFGSDDIRLCASAMIGLVSRVLDVGLPSELSSWECSRIDFALNYDLGGVAQVRTGLNWLRYAEGGRYRGRSAGTSIYWGQRSSRLSGKAYGKGDHQRRAVKRGEVELSESELSACDRLLRLELSLRRNFLRDSGLHWSAWTPEQLFNLHSSYFAPLLGSCEVTSMDSSLLDRLVSVCATEGLARAAFRTAALCAQVGPETTAESMPRTTWYRHRRALLDAGVSLADLRAGHVVPLRAQRIVLGAPVRSFSDLAA